MEDKEKVRKPCPRPKKKTKQEKNKKNPHPYHIVQDGVARRSMRYDPGYKFHWVVQLVAL